MNDAQKAALQKRMGKALKKLIPEGWCGTIVVGVPLEEQHGHTEVLFSWRGMASQSSAALLLETTAKIVRSQTH